jgi:uncharacterized repeat protein (TIGR03847 family)
MPDLDFPQPDRFTTGTVGPPGQRVFYLQVAEGGHVATFKVEKQQVAALADSLEELLSDLPAIEHPTTPDVGFSEPAIHEWVVGAMGVGYDEVDDRILVAAQELLDDDPDVEPSDEDGPATARVILTRTQAQAFVHHARLLVEAGRPPCRVCGRPLDPDGHACPRMN